MNTAFREKLKDKQRIVIKIGSSSLTHPDTGYLDLIKLEVLVREISDLRNQGKDVILVSSGAIMVGSKTMGYDRKTVENGAETGLCGHRTGKTHDDLSEIICRIQSGCQSDPDDQTHDSE